MSFHPTRAILSGSSTASSRAWIARQSRDPYVRQRNSHPAAFRSRSAFKLLEIDEKHGGFLTHKDVRAVVDLGAAPGGWSQVMASKLGWTEEFNSGSDHRTLPGRRAGQKKRGASEPIRRPLTDHTEDIQHQDISITHQPPSRTGQGVIVAVDLLPIAPIPGVHTLRADFLSPKSTVLIQQLLACPDNPDGKADVILSDMAANFSGNRIRDVESSLIIAESVFDFVARNLRTAESKCRRNGGALLCVVSIFRRVLALTSRLIG
jgi:23S rRNA (uridine2552-2'-O)-methyltransferase